MGSSESKQSSSEKRREYEKKRDKEEYRKKMKDAANGAYGRAARIDARNQGWGHCGDGRYPQNGRY